MEWIKNMLKKLEIDEKTGYEKLGLDKNLKNSQDFFKFLGINNFPKNGNKLNSQKNHITKLNESLRYQRKINNQTKKFLKNYILDKYQLENPEKYHFTFKNFDFDNFESSVLTQFKNQNLKIKESEKETIEIQQEDNGIQIINKQIEV